MMFNHKTVIVIVAAAAAAALAPSVFGQDDTRAGFTVNAVASLEELMNSEWIFYVLVVGIVFLFSALGACFLWSAPSKKPAAKLPIVLSLCPMATRGNSKRAIAQREKPNKRAYLNRLSIRRFSAFVPSMSISRFSSVDEVKTSKRSFWDLYKDIAKKETGLMEEMCDSTFPNAPKLRAIMNLAEKESPEHYSRARADEYRAWLAWRLTDIDSGDGGKDLQNELEALSRTEIKVVLSGCVYLRHAWHQGNPNMEPVPEMDPTDSYGNIIREPRQIKMAVEFAAEKLGVAPYFDLYQFLNCNWKWTPADSSTRMDRLMGTQKEEILTYEKICDLNAGSISPRFFWLTGPARESEAHFWRAFAYSEFLAVPMYGEVGKLIDETNDFSEGGLPTPPAIANVLRSLRKIRDVAHNITAVLVARLTPELIDARHFRQIQHTGHFAGTETAGASGYQAPCIVILDVLLGVDESTLPVGIQQTRKDHMDRMLPEVISLLVDTVRPGAKALRAFIESVPSNEKKNELKTAFNAMGNEVLMWRRSHRARAGPYLETSTVTAARTSGEMGGDVHRTFMDEMNTIILATKATLFKL